jgi:hypothetical protein
MELPMLVVAEAEERLVVPSEQSVALAALVLSSSSAINKVRHE